MTNLEYGDDLPDGNHVMRFCGYSTLDQKHNRNVPHAKAFMPKPKEKGKISVNWREYFRTDDDREMLQEFIRVTEERGLYQFGTNGKFAKMNVDDLRASSLSVMYTPNAKNPSHSSIHIGNLANAVALATEIRHKVTMYPVAKLK